MHIMSKSDQDNIDTSASDWVVRSDAGPLSASEQQALCAWLKADPRHRTAFKEARTAWGLLGQLRNPSIGCHDPVSRRSGAQMRPARRMRVRSRMAALAVCLLLIGGASFWFSESLLLLATADHRTGTGERLLITLTDGSRVDLGPDSAIAVEYGDQERRIRLLSGLAYFSVTAEPQETSRPFVVVADSGTARALGTEYQVCRLPSSVAVTVVEHNVEVVQNRPDGGQRRVMLGTGQSVHYNATGLTSPQNVNLAQATAWRRDRLIFDRAPLAEGIKVLSRYRHGRLLIVDSKLAERRVSGIFHTKDPDAMLATIVRDLHLRTLSLPPFVTLLY
jgi:transmembrane sensor